MAVDRELSAIGIETTERFLLTGSRRSEELSLPFPASLIYGHDSHGVNLCGGKVRRPSHYGSELLSVVDQLPAHDPSVFDLEDLRRRHGRHG